MEEQAQPVTVALVAPVGRDHSGQCDGGNRENAGGCAARDRSQQAGELLPDPQPRAVETCPESQADAACSDLCILKVALVIARVTDDSLGGQLVALVVPWERPWAVEGSAACGGRLWNWKTVISSVSLVRD